MFILTYFMSNLSSKLQTRYHRPQQVERLNDLVPIWICAISSPKATIKATPEQPIPPQTRTLKLSTKGHREKNPR